MQHFIQHVLNRSLIVLLYSILFMLCVNFSGNAIWARHPSDCSDTNTEYEGDEYWPNMVFTIPVWVHVVRQSDGMTGDISDAQIYSQIEILNEDFGARPHTPGRNGFDTGIQFRLAGIERHNNDCVFGKIVDLDDFTTVQCIQGMAKDPNQYLNIYTIDTQYSTTENLNGFSALPWAAAGMYFDGVYVEYKHFGRNSPGAYPSNQGRTTTKLVGYYLGLLEIKPEGSSGCESCAKPECYQNGDLICDTNDQENRFYDEPCPKNPVSCGTPDSYTNYMNTTGDACKDRFTEEQARRMRCVIEHYRPGIVDNTLPGTVPVYRFYSNQLLTHFFTNSAYEKDTMIATFSDDVWRYEGVSWYVFADSGSGASPIYRFYSDTLKRHFYTIDAYEKDSIIANFPVEMWRYEGIAWYVYASPQPGTLPVYRFYSDTLLSHLYTMDEYEKNYIIANYPMEMWRYEGVAYYAFPAGY